MKIKDIHVGDIVAIGRRSKWFGTADRARVVAVGVKSVRRVFSWTRVLNLSHACDGLVVETLDGADPSCAVKIPALREKTEDASIWRSWFEHVVDDAGISLGEVCGKRVVCASNVLSSWDDYVAAQREAEKHRRAAERAERKKERDTRALKARAAALGLHTIAVWHTVELSCETFRQVLDAIEQKEGAIGPPLVLPKGWDQFKAEEESNDAGA